MEGTWISWRTTTTLFIAVLQIQALISVNTTDVTGAQGQRFDFRCEYRNTLKSNAKYFWYDSVPSKLLIWTEKHDQWEKDGRFSLYDNTTGAFFIVRVEKLTSEDSGTYRCGVHISLYPADSSFIRLNVSQVFFAVTGPPVSHLTVDKLQLSLFVTAVMCMAAMLFICLFTLCLLLAIKHRRPSPRQNRETSSDYETMMPGVTTEPEALTSFSDRHWADQSALPEPPQTDLCSHFNTQHRESTVTVGLSEYVDVDVPKHICQYQHLDISQLEEHVYHSLNGSKDPKDEPLDVKEQIKC